MRLLRDLDYLRVIQSDNLDQIIQSNQQTRLDVEQAAQAEMISYLAQRYITGEVFTNTTIFDYTAVYSGKNLVYINATAFSAATVYLINQLVLQAGNVYRSIAGSAAHTFNIAEWTLVGAQYDWFYVKLPYTEWSVTTTYAAGDQAWYQNKTYTASIPSVGILPTESAYWGTGTNYTVTAVWPTDTTKWSTGDNRNQLIVLHLINITLYHLHFRINPRLIPDHRKEAYNGNSPTDSGGAIGWLKRVASGDVTADLPNIMPQQGMSIRHGNANDANTLSNNFRW